MSDLLVALLGVNAALTVCEAVVPHMHFPQRGVYFQIILLLNNCYLTFSGYPYFYWGTMLAWLAAQPYIWQAMLVNRGDLRLTPRAWHPPTWRYAHATTHVRCAHCMCHAHHHTRNNVA